MRLGHGSYFQSVKGTKYKNVSQTSESYITDLIDIWKNRSGLWGLPNLGALETSICKYCIYLRNINPFHGI
jgi:hypothetical protein